MIGVEPHPDLVALAARRTRALPNVTVLPGTAQAMPLPDASVDVVHARWAYFFGPGCEPGLRELDRVVRRGGTAFVIDNDAHAVDVRRLVPARLPEDRPGRRRAVLGRRTAGPRRRSTSAGASTPRPTSRPSCASSSTPDVADEVLAEHDGHDEVDYAVNLWSQATSDGVSR